MGFFFFTPAAALLAPSIPTTHVHCTVLQGANKAQFFSTSHSGEKASQTPAANLIARKLMMHSVIQGFCTRYLSISPRKRTMVHFALAPKARPLHLKLGQISLCLSFSFFPRQQTHPSGKDWAGMSETLDSII